MRFVNPNPPVIDQAATGDIASIAMDAHYITTVSGQVVTTGTLAGTFKLQCSNDTPTPGHAPTHWSDIPAASGAISGAGIIYVPPMNICNSFLRADFVYASGSGNVTANINAFGF